MRREDVPILTEVANYAGQEVVKVSCTQLGTNHTAAQARRVVADWTDFFSSGPSAMRDLEFVTRTPKRLFASLQGQTQLRRLAIKWGDYEDLSAVSGLHELRVLTLRGGLMCGQRPRSFGPRLVGMSRDRGAQASPRHDAPGLAGPPHGT